MSGTTGAGFRRESRSGRSSRSSRRRPRGLDGPPSGREIGLLSYKHRRAIEFLQPYNGRNDKYRGVRWALGHITRLNNIDKHRHLHVVRRGVIAIRPPHFPPDCGFTYETFWVPLESHVEVQRWTFRKTPPNIAEEVKKQNQVIADVLLEEGSNRFRIYELLYSLVRAVESVLYRFETFLPAY